MRIGILTLNNENNYGAVLQTFAMVEAYRELGYDPIIINKWHTKNNESLIGHLVLLRSFRGWVWLIVNLFLTVGLFSELVRRLKTWRFGKRYFPTTSYHFYSWENAPSDLGVDIVSVGSDQIWNANLVNTRDYLLEFLPSCIHRISYAASFGMNNIPSKLIPSYRRGLARFSAVGVREKTGKLLAESLGVKAEVVVDPTLLINPNTWNKFASSRRAKKRLLCYFLGENVAKMLDKLKQFSQRNDFDIVVLVGMGEGIVTYRRNIFKAYFARIQRKLSRIKIDLMAGPEDFVREFSLASCIISNSYHALMFATIFGKDIRIIEPLSPVRQEMQNRMYDFAKSFIKTNVFAADIDDALKQCAATGSHTEYDFKAIESARAKSAEWLKNAIASCR